MTTEEKEIAYYSQGVAAFYNTAMERDKTLLSLSTAGIGVLMTLMHTALDSITVLIIYYLAIFSLLICIFSVVLIFQQNKKHLTDVLMGKTEKDDPCLTILDNVAKYSFLLGLLFCVIIGISSATSTYIEREKTMATKKSETSTQTVFKDSFNGVAKLKPTQPTPAKPVPNNTNPPKPPNSSQPPPK